MFKKIRAFRRKCFPNLITRCGGICAKGTRLIAEPIFFILPSYCIHLAGGFVGNQWNNLFSTLCQFLFLYMIFVVSCLCLSFCLYVTEYRFQCVCGGLSKCLLVIMNICLFECMWCIQRVSVVVCRIVTLAVWFLYLSVSDSLWVFCENLHFTVQLWDLSKWRRKIIDCI